MPLSDEERAELEALRAEKKHREEAERARAERAELEALRAERAAAGSVNPAEYASPVTGDASMRTQRPPAVPDDLGPRRPSESKTFGERMVTSSSVDKDGIPTMPAAQRLIIIACLVALTIFVMIEVVF